MADQSNVILQIIARLRDELSAPLAKIRKLFVDTAPEVNKLGKESRETGKFLGEALKAATGFAGGFGIVEGISKTREAITDLVRESIELERALGVVEVASDDASVHVDSFRDSVRGLAVEFGKSATSIARSAGVIAEQTSLRTAEQIQKLNELVQEFATLGLGKTPEEAAQRTVNLLKAFQINPADIDRVRAALAGIRQEAREANVPFSTFADSLIAIGPSSLNAKATLEEMEVVIADVSKRGVDAGQATSTLVRFVEQLRDRTSPARAEIEKFTGALDDN